MAGNDIFFYQNNDVNIDITVTDDSGDVVDITGGIFMFTMKGNLSDADADAVISKDVTSHTDPQSGLSRISLSKSDTDVAAKEYDYDITFVDSGGNKTTYVAGKCLVKQIVTKRDSAL